MKKTQIVKEYVCKICKRNIPVHCKPLWVWMCTACKQFLLFGFWKPHNVDSHEKVLQYNMALSKIHNVRVASFLIQLGSFLNTFLGGRITLQTSMGIVVHCTSSTQFQLETPQPCVPATHLQLSWESFSI